MSEVRRYMFDARAGTLSRDDGGAKMILSVNGELVSATDYDALDRDCDGYIEDRDLAYARIRELEAALRTIQQWDSLNPPLSNAVVGDLPWLKRVVDVALAGSPPSDSAGPMLTSTDGKPP